MGKKKTKQKTLSANDKVEMVMGHVRLKCTSKSILNLLILSSSSLNGTESQKTCVLWSTCKMSLFAILSLKYYKQNHMQRKSSISTTECGLRFPCIRSAIHAIGSINSETCIQQSGPICIFTFSLKIKEIYFTILSLYKEIKWMRKNRVKQDTSFKMLTLNDT